MKFKCVNVVDAHPTQFITLGVCDHSFEAARDNANNCGVRPKAEIEFVFKEHVYAVDRNRRLLCSLSKCCLCGRFELMSGSAWDAPGATVVAPLDSVLQQYPTLGIKRNETCGAKETPVAASVVAQHPTVTAFAGNQFVCALIRLVRAHRLSFSHFGQPKRIRATYLRNNRVVTTRPAFTNPTVQPWSVDLAHQKTVAVAGDWHHNTAWAVQTIATVSRSHIALLLHVGDFGVWPGQEHFLRETDQALQQHAMTMLVTPGNHEDWSLLDRRFAENGNRPFRPEGTQNIWVLPRGWRFEIGGVHFLSIGGAPSVDRDERLGENLDWWPTEIISDDVVDDIIQAGHAEVMLCHDSPSGSAEKVEEIALRRLVEHPQWRDYILRGRYQLNRIYEAVHPQLVLHGHYHLSGVGEHDGDRIIALNRDGQSHTTVALDLTQRTPRVQYLD